jgi:hypothetical protein
MAIQKVRFPILFPLKGFLHWVGKHGFSWYIYSPPQVRPGLLTKGLGALILHDNARPHSAAAAVNLLNSWGSEILPHPPYNPDLAPSDFHLFPKIKNTPEVSSSIPMKMFKMKSRNGCPGRIFFYEGLNKLIYRYDKCLNRLCDYAEKWRYMRLYLSLMSYSVFCYFI